MRGVSLTVRSAVAGWAFLVVVVAVVIGANAVLSHAPAEPRMSDVGSGAASAQPDVRQATSVARREFGLLAGGGWAQAWQLWSDEARSALGQDDFVRAGSRCRAALGVPYVIDGAARVDATTVSVSWHRSDAAGTATVVYEGGAWRFSPDAGSLGEYRREAAGRCG